MLLQSKMHKYNRHSLRLKHYDYSREGFYFITICTQNRLHLFGEIVDDVMVLNVAGEMLDHWYMELKNKFKHIKNHEMVVMPNHIHFIVEIAYGKNDGYATVGADLRVCPHDGNNKVVVGDIVQWFKTMTTNQYIKMVKNGTCPPFDKRIWQRNYYEHIIRDDVDYERISTYIINNPLTWEDDVLSKNQYPKNNI